MAVTVDERKTREYIQTLSGFVADTQRSLTSARRWPWKRSEIPGLLYEMAHNLVAVGVNWCVLGELDRARSSFTEALTAAQERFSAISNVQLGYHDVQTVAAAVVIGDEVRAAEVAALALDVSTRPHVDHNTAAINAACRAVFGWLLRRPEVVRTGRDAASVGELAQFKLWADVAWYGSTRDPAALASAFGQLISFVRPEVRRGDFKYSEDRFSYLPGQLLMILASRDGVMIEVPDEAWWKVCGT